MVCPKQIGQFSFQHLQAFWKKDGFSGEVVSSGGPPKVPGTTTGPICIGYDATSFEGNPALVAFIGGEQQVGYSKLSVSLLFGLICMFLEFKSLQQCFCQSKLVVVPRTFQSHKRELRWSTFWVKWGKELPVTGCQAKTFFFVLFIFLKADLVFFSWETFFRHKFGFFSLKTVFHVYFLVISGRKSFFPSERRGRLHFCYISLFLISAGR